MNPTAINDAAFYFALSVPLVGILVNVLLVTMLGRRLDRLADRVHHVGGRLARVEERLAR